MELTAIPAGYSLNERRLVPNEGGPAGIRTLYLRPGGADDQIGMLSGIAGGELGGPPTGDTVMFLGRTVAIERLGRSLVVKTVRGSEDDPCNYDTVLAAGLTVDDFRRLIEGIRLDGS
jgi:hypothetical protein